MGIAFDEVCDKLRASVETDGEPSENSRVGDDGLKDDDSKMEVIEGLVGFPVDKLVSLYVMRQYGKLTGQDC